MVQVLPVLLDASKNRDPNLRQCAVYGLGALAEHRPEGFRQIAATAIQTLLAVINDAEAKCVVPQGLSCSCLVIELTSYQLTLQPSSYLTCPL